MTLIEHLNLYFGTEYESVKEFIIDFKRGDLAEDYINADEKLEHLLMFISTYDWSNRI